MKCLIVGGSGFIGANLLERLVPLNQHKITLFDLPNKQTDEIRKQFPQIEIYPYSFENQSKLAEAIEGQDVVVHLVHTTLPLNSSIDPIYDIKTNLIPTLNLIQLAHKFKINRIIFSSSGGTVYGNASILPTPETHPTNPHCAYGISKLAIEKYLQFYGDLFGIETVTLRLSNPYGPGQRRDRQQGVVTKFLSNITSNKPIEIWGDGSVIRDFIYIDDVVDALTEALTCPLQESQTILNVGTGVGTSLTNLVKELEITTGVKTQIKFHSARPIDVPTNILDISKIKNQLNFSPKFNLQEGLKIYWDKLKTQK
ncbi:NAD-dependent epimerase/dehydratase family protein [Bdellovibrionota bacterium]